MSNGTKTYAKADKLAGNKDATKTDNRGVIKNVAESEVDTGFQIFTIWTDF